MELEKELGMRVWKRFYEFGTKGRHAFKGGPGTGRLYTSLNPV